MDTQFDGLVSVEIGMQIKQKFFGNSQYIKIHNVLDRVKILEVCARSLSYLSRWWSSYSILVCERDCDISSFIPLSSYYTFAAA